MTSDEHLVKVEVALIDAKYHLDGAKIHAIREAIFMPQRSAIVSAMNSLANVENLVIDWRREAKRRGKE